MSESPSTEGVAEETDHPRVLIVDDSPTVRELMRATLASAPLFAEVFEASDGTEALRLALEDHFDCILCDIQMPRLDGMSFLKQLRSRYSRMEVPLVFLTVVESTRDKVAGFRAGASDFLVKPVAQEEILARVETQVQLARMHRQLRRLNDRLKVLVDTDPLTQLGNRRLFMRNLRAEFARADRQETNLALLMVDVDRFKSINDSQGHQAGDEVLVDVGRVLVEQARQYDTVARIGGEEFAVLLPDIDGDAALRVAERVRAAIEAKCSEGRAFGVTASVGVGFGPAPGKDHPEALFKRADEQLYEAKAAGRNRVAPAS